MIHCTIDIGQKEIDILKELMLNSDVNVKKRKVMVPICGIMAVLCLGEVILCLPLDALDILMLLFSIFFAFMALGGARLFQKAIINGAVKKSMRRTDSALYYGTREYKIDESGIQIISQYGSGENYWNAFREYGMVDNYVYITRKDNQKVLINCDVLTAEEHQELMRILESKLENKAK